MVGKKLPEFGVFTHDIFDGTLVRAIGSQWNTVSSVGADPTRELDPDTSAVYSDFIDLRNFQLYQTLCIGIPSYVVDVDSRDSDSIFFLVGVRRIG